MQLGTESDPEPTFIARLLTGWVSTVCRRPRRVLFLAVLASATSLWASARHLQYQTQRSDLISSDKDSQRLWQRYVAEFGDDDDIVVVVKGGEPADGPRMKAALGQIAGAVGSHPDFFDRVFYRVDLRHLRDRALLFLPTDQISRIRANLSGMDLLLEIGPLAWRNLTLTSLLREASIRAERLALGEPIPSKDEPFFTQLGSVCASAVATLQNRADYRNPWRSLMDERTDQQRLLDEPQYFFSGDGTLAFLLARPIKVTGSFTGAAQSVAVMRDIVAGAKASFHDLEIGVTGLPVLETDEMVAAERDTQRASWLAIGGVTLLFFVVYRGFYYPLLTVATLLLGTSWAMGWTTLTVGHLNILSATFAVMLIGMGDYGVLWVMRYERERRRGLGVEDALRHTAVCVGTGTLTAALTTAVAFYAAMLADFKAVAELGWIAGSGVLFCAFACFTVLPAVLKIFDRRIDSCSSFILHPSSFERWLPGLAVRSRWVLVGGLALAVVLGISTTHVSYDHNLLNLQPRDLDSVKWEKTLIEHTAGASWHAISYTRTPEEALALKARYEMLPEVSRVIEVASLVPPEQQPKLELLRDIRRRLARLPINAEAIAHDLPVHSELHKAATLALSSLEPLRDETSPSVFGGVHKRIRELQNQLTDGTEQRIRDFEDRMAGDLLTDLHRLRQVSTPEPITIDDLPDALRERYVGANGHWKLQAFARESLWDFGPLQHFVDRIRTIDPDATGKPFATVEGLLAMKHGFMRAGLYAFFAIVAVLLLDFRNIGRTGIAISPLLLGLIFALGIMGLFGIRLNPANMIALPLVLGVGVDNGVHILHDFLARKAEGRFHLSRAIGRGVLVKALTTIIGFGTLIISTQPGLAGLGFCLALGVACCMTTSLLFLPAVLQIRPTPKDVEATKEVSEPYRLAA